MYAVDDVEKSGRPPNVWHHKEQEVKTPNKDKPRNQMLQYLGKAVFRLKPVICYSIMVNMIWGKVYITFRTTTRKNIYFT